MRRLIILMMVVAAALAGQPLKAQLINKLSASTQMFLDEQAGRISLDASEQQVQERAKARGITTAEARKLVKWDRPIAAPVTLDGQKFISAFVRVTDASAQAQLEALGVKIECEFLGGTLYTTLIPVDKIEAVAAIASVRRVSVATKKRPLTNAARQYTNVDDVLAYTADARAAGLPNAFDGSGVLLGVIDTGIDFQHKAFKDKNGNTRIKRAYVVTATTSYYGGTTYSANEYGDGAANAITSSAPTTDDTNEDHGTHTSSTAGGSSVIINGSTTTVTDDHANASYGGMAPGADLFLAGCDLSDTYLANSFQKICNYADSKGLPVVVSNSWGSGIGPHDGTGDFADITTQYFNDNNPNHICLFAASNDAGTNGFHVSGTASSSSPLGTVLNYNTDYVEYYYQILASAWTRSTGKTLNCKIIVIDSSGSKQTEVTVNPSTNGSTVSGLSNYVSSGSLVAYRDYAGGSNKSQILLYTSKLQMRSGYKLAVQFYPSSGSDIVDVWSGSYTYYTSTPATSGYNWTAGSDDMCVSDEATFPNVISIGAYSTKNKVTDYNNTSHTLSDFTVGDIAYFSSYATADQSPTGLAYPWICAPGATIVSAVNAYDTSGDVSYINGNSAYYGLYRVNTDKTNPYGSMEGTSMATPAAAGIVALWLQAAKSVGKELTTSDIKEIMKETAIKDSYVTTGANRTHFGNGKIDALAGIQYILGDVTPMPTITANPTTLNFSGIAGQTYTQTLTVSGRNLESDITITKSENAAYAVDQTTITCGSDGTANATVTVTYMPTTAGNTTATLTLASTNAEDVTVTLNGTAEPAPLETYAPVLLDASNIKANSFTATWTDQTPAENVESYTLYVSSKPAVALLDSIDWTASNAIPTGWTQSGLQYYSSNSACYLSSTGYVQSKTYDLTGYDKMTVMVYAEPYNSGNTITVTTSAGSKTVSLSGSSFAWYTLVVDCASSDYVKLTASGLPDMRSMKVYAGELTGTQHTVSETGDDTQRVITGITDKSYTVNGLTNGGTFFFYVAANYANGTIDNSNTKEVTLTATPAPVMQPADESYIKHTSFRADWTDDNPAEDVASYTLWVNYVVPAPIKLGTIDGSNYTGSYEDITLSEPWGGTNTVGGNNAVYFRNLTNSNGNITFTIPEGYNNATFSMRITSASSNYGVGNITVQSEQTEAVGVSFTSGLTNTWLVKGSTGEKITITSTDDNYSPDMTMIEVYSGDITAQATALHAVAEQGDSTTRTITGITDRFYVVKDLTGGGTFDFKVKTIYNDGSESKWSNIEQVTLSATADEGLLGDLNQDGSVDVLDINILINIVLGKDNADNYGTRAYINDDDVIDSSDINLLINIALGKYSAR